MSEFNEFMAALTRLEKRHGHIILKASFGDAVTIISQIQLAIRHPGNTGPSSGDAHRIVTDMIMSMTASEPRLRELLMKGFDPSSDVPRGKEN